MPKMRKNSGHFASFGRIFGALALVCAVCAGSARADHTVGNGGDPIIILFTDARHDAQAMLASLATSGLPAGVDSTVRDFLLATDPASHQPRFLAMGDDILRDRHLWQVGDFNGGKRCATTNLPPSSALPDGRTTDLYLSIPNCHTAVLASTAAEAMVARLLIREACHHFGLGDNQDPEGDDAGDLENEISKVVYNVWLAQRDGRALAWRDVPGVGSPSARFRQSAVWTGHTGDPRTSEQVLIWGGCYQGLLPDPAMCDGYLKDGARLRVVRESSDGAADAPSWLPMASAQAPVGRIFHTAVWTGDADLAAISQRMLVFGGCTGKLGICDSSLNDTAVYDPANDQWTTAGTTRAPVGRVAHTGIWTGSQLLIWGGEVDYSSPDKTPSALGDGAALTFDPAQPSGLWTTLPHDASTPTPRFGHTAVWTGTEMLIWGGCGKAGVIAYCDKPLADGAAFNPTTGHWRSLPPAPLDARSGHSAVWTGRYMLIWGGSGAVSLPAIGAIYDSQNDQWRPMSGLLPNSEGGRLEQQAVWDGLQGRMVVWGGQSALGAPVSSTLIFDPDQGQYGSWSLAPVRVGPDGRIGSSVLWLEDALMIWGGLASDDTFANSGALLSP